MKILVTGGAGFIGSALIRHIISTTDHTVMNIDKLTYAGNLDSLKDISNSSRYYFECLDINSDELRKIFETFRPELIMHLAAESHVDKSIDSSEEFIRTNILGTYRILEQSRRYWKTLDSNEGYKFRFHHISTDEVFGDLGEGSSSLFNESTAYSPSSPYSASKASSDHLVRAWGKTYNLPIIITNCSNNYGPYQFPEKLIPHVILNALNNMPIPVYGNGLQIRDWLYVDDHVEGLLKVAQKGKVGSTYNLGGNCEKTNIDLIKDILKILEGQLNDRLGKIHSFKDLICHVKDRPGHDFRYAIDTSKVSKEIGWLPKETIESGLKKTVNWYLDNEDWWAKILSGEYKLMRQG